MDSNLFAKYTKQIIKQKNKKEEIIILLQETTGIILEEHEVEIDNTTVFIYTSSIKKNILHKKNTKHILKEKGYTLQ
jgi:hypothetical protein